MVNFRQLISQKNQTPVVEPRKLFGTLQRQEGYEYLRDVQGDVLDEWYDRRDARDLVIKMNTGAGKTLVGLVILQSRLNEGKGPAIYLCPDRYLVSQVQREADSLGIKHTDFGPDNLFPAEFHDSEALLVTTVQKLFNGLSVFRVAGKPNPVSVGTILVDDAHACINIAHEQFTAKFSKETPVGRRLASFFDGEVKQQSVGLHADITQGKRDAYVRVPYWAWQRRLGDVADLFSENQDTDELRFIWPFLKNGEVLSNSISVVSGDRVEIAPSLIPINLVPSFDNAPHRVYMSATLLDDAALIKDFAAEPESIKVPIKPKVGGDIGERLIISPLLIAPTFEEITTTQLVSEIQSRHQINVVILVPSSRRAEIWKAERPEAMVVPRADISEVVERLCTSDSNTAIFANRYDGIDLPNDACRVLVLDELPQEYGLIRLSEATARQDSPILKKQIAQRIEQGMGRGVRSRSDYCVVILTGRNLLSFMTEVNNQTFFTDDTKQQIEIGKELSTILKENQATNSYQAILDLVSQCLGRDTDWLEYHREKVQGAQNSLINTPTSIELASVELRAWQYALKGQYNRASAEISRLINTNEDLPDVDAGWYLQIGAAYHYHLDLLEAQDKQIKAHDLNPKLLKPLEGVNYRKVQRKNTGQSYSVLSWAKSFTEPNASVNEANRVFENLSFGINANDFEKALNDLAFIIGFQSQQPDAKPVHGPDVLWQMADGHYLIIEAKNQVNLDRETIYKSEAEQLSHHVTWFEQTYSGESYTPVLIHPSVTLAPDAYLPKGTRVVQADCLQQIVESVRKFVVMLATKRSDQWSAPDIQDQLATYALRPTDFLDKLLGKEARK